MAKIWNFTPHSVNIIKGSKFEPTIRKKVANLSANVFMIIPSDGMLNARMESQEIEDFLGIPQFESVPAEVDPIPQEVGNDDIVVVSRMYASAYIALNGRDSRLRCIKDVVVDETDYSRIIGCSGLERP